MIANPRHRQVREHLLVLTNAFGQRGAAGRRDRVGMRQHHALRNAGGPRRVADHRDVVARALRDLVVEIRRVLLRERAPALLECGQAQEARLAVPREPSRVVVDDRLEPRTLRPDVEQLVDLLLVLDHREARLGVIHDVRELALDRVLVERYRDAAERLRRHHGPVELRTVVADDRDLVAPGESERRQPESDPSRPLEGVLPGGRLPDPVVLFADGDGARRAFGVPTDELRERVELRVDHTGAFREGLPGGEKCNEAGHDRQGIYHYDGHLRRAIPRGG